MKTNRRIMYTSFFVVSLILCMICMTVLCIHIHTFNKELIIVDSNTVNDFTNQQGTSEYQFNIESSQIWVTGGTQRIGTQIEGLFINNTRYPLQNWEITMTVPDGSKVDSTWNGIFIQNGKQLTISPVHYNQVIRSADQMTFGMMTRSSVNFSITDCKIQFTRKATLGMFPLFWGVLIYIGVLSIMSVSSLIIKYRYRDMQKKQHDSDELILQSMKTFARIIDIKDAYTQGHSERVALYSMEIGRRMHLSENEQRKLYYIGLLHDIGKVGIPDDILNKPGRLTDEEYNIIKQHVTYGGEILESFTALPEAAEGAKYHHERFDGKGYIYKLNGFNIPLFARIICVADAYDAMSSERCYRSRMTEEHILSELESCAGSQFDPVIAHYMIEMIHSKAVPCN